MAAMVSSMTGIGSVVFVAAGVVEGVVEGVVAGAETDAVASVAVGVAVETDAEAPAGDVLEAARLISCTSLGSASSFVHRGALRVVGAAE
jgi:hypothetical protein